MTERMIEVDGVELCTEAFGDPTDPPILLIMGIGASMLWWDDGFCRMLADGGRCVVRYDHRDTGRSTTCPPGHPDYTGADLAADAARVLDGYGLEAAHLVGVSAGAAFAQVLGLTVPERVLSLVLISSCPATPGDRDLPPPTDAFITFVSTGAVDWTDAQSVIDHQVGYSRVLAGDQRRFDEASCRELVRRDVERASDVTALQNHDLLDEGEGPSDDISAITAPTLVVHGTADPLFPPDHGRALASEIPAARLLLLDGAGHGVDRTDRDTLVAAILDHTGPPGRA